MNNVNNLFWLSSYPKSGNTWFRTFLTSLLINENKELNINELGYRQYPNSRDVFDELNGFCSVDLSLSEINNLRAQGLMWLSCQSNARKYYKTHAAYTYNADGSPVLGSSETGIAGALHFVRNPLDVCISYAHHGGFSIDKSIDVLARPLMSHGSNRSMFIPEKVLSWSEHVESWSNATEVDVKIIRYEDMLNEPVVTFSSACDFLKLEVGSKQIEQSLDRCRFDKLKRLENQTGFSEKPKQSNRFFRKGIAGDWQQTLTEKQIDKVINAHADTMRRYDYLDDQGRPKIY